MSNTKTKTKRKFSGLYWGLGAAILAVSILLFCQFFFVDNLSPNDKFLNGTKVNGIDVSGMTRAEAENIVSYSLLSSRDEIELKLKYGDRVWVFTGDDFEVVNEVEPVLTQALKVGREGGMIKRFLKKQEVKKNGLNIQVSYKTVLGGLEEKVEAISAEIDTECEEPKVIFDPNGEPMFSLSEGKDGIVVDRGRLYDLIDDALNVNKQAEIDIPIMQIPCQFDEDAALSSIALRSSFSTSYSSSSDARKNNVSRALNSFNGKVIMPGEEVSFNNVTGPRSTENGYKQANIILNGAYVKGTGGGVCQASTTLYNALLLAGIDVTEANHHSLPASYVPLSFDAMVSEGYSDLVFVNNLDTPIYIKTYSDKDNVYVEIYGKPFEEGKSIRTRAEFIKVLPHGGDKIIDDVSGEYSNFVIYKGEYYRVRYPREGYESKGYLQYLQNGEVVEEKELRHDFYYAQDGIIVQGVNELGEGMTLPENDVQFIPPQKVTTTTTETVRAKIEKQRPSAYNP